MVKDPSSAVEIPVPPKILSLSPLYICDVPASPFVNQDKPVTSTLLPSFLLSLNVPSDGVLIVPPVTNVSVPSIPVIVMSDSNPPFIAKVIVPALYVPEVMNGSSKVPFTVPVPEPVSPHELS